jgi:hypothetical protein
MKHKITIYFKDGTIEEYITENFSRYQMGFFEIVLTETNWLSIPAHMIQYIEGETLEG